MKNVKKSFGRNGSVFVLGLAHMLHECLKSNSNDSRIAAGRLVHENSLNTYLLIYFDILAFKREIDSLFRPWFMAP